MVPLVTYHPRDKKSAALCKEALEKEFPHHSFDLRDVPDQGLHLVLLPSPDGPYTDAVQWYAIGFKDGNEGK